MKDDDIQRTNQANTRRKRSPCAPNRGRTYDLPIRTSEALPLSCKRLVIGERGLYFELNCDVTLAESVMKFDLSSHNFAISNVDCDTFRMHIASLLLLLLSLVQKRSLLKSMRHDQHAK